MKDKIKLEQILKVEAEIATLSMKRNLLGSLYVGQNCPFKLGDKVEIEDESGTTRGIIFKIDFDSHSNIEGLARIGISPINKKGLRIIDRNGIFFNNVKDIKQYIVD